MDFLTRLVERQRNEQIGVRPVLPSRYEREAVRALQPVSTPRPTEPRSSAVTGARFPTPAQPSSAAGPEPTAQQPDAQGQHRLPAPPSERAATPPAPQPPSATSDPLPMLLPDLVPVHHEGADGHNNAEHQPLLRPATVVQQQVTARSSTGRPVAVAPTGPPAHPSR